MQSVKVLAAAVVTTLLISGSGCSLWPWSKSASAQPAAASAGSATAAPADGAPPANAAEALPKQPEPGKAVVYVLRPSSQAMLIRFNVFVDDQKDSSEVGYTRSGQYIYFNLLPGQHKIYSKAEEWAETTLSVRAGDIVFLRQEPAQGAYSSVNTIDRVPDDEGRAQLKRLSLGTIRKLDR
jgi:hypothetical protein